MEFLKNVDALQIIKQLNKICNLVLLSFIRTVCGSIYICSATSFHCAFLSAPL